MKWIIRISLFISASAIIHAVGYIITGKPIAMYPSFIIGFILAIAIECIPNEKLKL